MSGVILTSDPDEAKANGQPVSTFDMNDIRRLNHRLLPRKVNTPPQRIVTEANLEQIVARNMPHSTRPKLPSAILQITLPEDAKLGLETDYVHVPYQSNEQRLKNLNEKRLIAIYPKAVEEALCQTPTPVEPTSRPTGQFFKSLGKYTGFSLMVNTLRKLLRRTSNSSK